MIEIDNKKMWESLIWKVGEPLRQHIENALSEQGLTVNNNGEIVSIEPEQEVSEELTELDDIQKIIYNLLSSTNGEWLEEDYMTEMSKNISEDIRKQIASEILTKRNIDTYIGQVKNARETIPYSHQTLIWNVLADLEDDLVELKKIKEG